MDPHVYLTVIVPALLTFVATVGAVRFIIGYFSEAGIIAEDRNKGRPIKLPSSGGVGVAFGIIFGILIYIFGATYIFKPILSIPNLFAASLSIMLIAFVGFIDDINVKGRRVWSTGMKSINKGLERWQKPLLTALGAIPLMAINAGVSTVYIPGIGALDLFLIYPLVIIPLAVIFVSNAVNLLGGFDGLQACMTAVAAFGLLLYSFFYGNGIGLLLSALLLSAIIGFMPFNLYKAKIIPGDSFTYVVGAALVTIMIMGNAEFFGIIIFIPWFAEFFLHLRRRFDVTDLGIPQKDGTLKAPYGKKIYSLAHLVMNMKRIREPEMAIYLSALEFAFVLLAFAIKIFVPHF
ncbi:MAG: hypothetical protein QXF41_02155 [Candidatus Micrarchaeaceae archaeon]